MITINRDLSLQQ